MTKITLRKSHRLSPDIVQSRLKRDWMDETYKKHAYHCLPMAVANVLGWEVSLPHDVVVVWDGGSSVPRVLEGEFYQDYRIVNQSIVGAVTFSIGWTFKTEPGYSIGVSGPPNYFVDGAHAMAAVVPTSWWPDEFQMNWKIDKIGEPVVFPSGRPFCFISVIDDSLASSVSFEIDSSPPSQEFVDSRVKYGELKNRNNEENPWTWTKGIRTGVNADGLRIGPAFPGLPKLDQPCRHDKITDDEEEAHYKDGLL